MHAQNCSLFDKFLFILSLIMIFVCLFWLAVAVLLLLLLLLFVLLFFFSSDGLIVFAAVVAKGFLFNYI